MKWNDHKRMKLNEMYLSKGKEWNKVTLIRCFKIKEWK